MAVNGRCHNCENCGVHESESRLEAAHVQGRRHRGTRWGALIDGEYDLCGHRLCHACHQGYDEHNVFIERQVREMVILEARYDKIGKIARSVAKNQDFEEIKRELEKILKAQEG